MKKLLLLFAFFAATASAQVGVKEAKNRNLDKDVVISVNDGGVITPVITVVGATSSLVLPSNAAQTNGILNFNGTSNAVINAQEGFTFNIDSDNNETDRLFQFRSNVTTGAGTLLFTVDENPQAAVGVRQACDNPPCFPKGFGGSTVRSPGLGLAANSGVPVYYGTRGAAWMFVCSQNNATGQNTSAHVYLVRSSFDGTGWTQAQNVTLMGASSNITNPTSATIVAGPAGAFTFSCNPNCSTITATIDVVASNNWQCQIYGNG